MWVIHPFPGGLLEITGKDRVPFLHNILSHDIKGLPTGQGRPVCLLNRQGQIRFGGFLHAGETAHWLELPGGQAPAVQAMLEPYVISESVAFQDRSSDLQAIPLLGEGTDTLLQKICSIPAPLQQHLQGAAPTGDPVRWIIRWHWNELAGFVLWVDAGQTESVRKNLLQRGAEAAGPERFHALRIAAVVPWAPQELNETVLLNELETEKEPLPERSWVSYNKGCFIGQEIVARIHWRTQPPRKLTRFILSGEKAPETPAPLMEKGTVVGQLTSAARLEETGQIVGLGLLKTGCASTRMEVQTAAGTIQAERTGP